MALMEHSVDVKLAFVTDGPTGWLDLFVRAIFCNFFINLAMLMVYNGAIKEDLVKALVMIVCVFVFAYLGFEHSVANTVLFTIVGPRPGDRHRRRRSATSSSALPATSWAAGSSSACTTPTSTTRPATCVSTRSSPTPRGSPEHRSRPG